MALQKQNVAVTLSQGADTKSDPKSVVPGKLLTLENGVFKARNRISKRNGYDELGKGIVGSVSQVSTGQGLASYQDELCLFDETSIYSYDAGNDAWIDKGAFASVNVTQRPVIRNTYQQTAQDSATHSTGLQCFAWEDSQGGVRYAVIDSSTGLSIVPNSLVASSASRPKVLAFGTKLLIFYVSGQNLFYAPIGVASPNVLGASVLLTSVLASGATHYDAEVIGERCFVVWNKSGGNIEMGYLLTTLSASSSVQFTGPAVCLSVFEDSLNGNVVVAWHDGNFVRFTVYDYGLSSAIKAPTITETVVGIVNITGSAISGTSSLFRLFYSKSAPTASNYAVKTSTVTAYVPAAATYLLHSVGLAGKAFNYGSRSYVPVAYESTLQSTYFVADHAGQLVAKLFYGLGGGLPTRSILPEVDALSASKFQLSCLVKDLLATDGGNVFTQTGVSSVVIDFFDPANSYLSGELGLNLHVGGGYLQMYDGAGPVEHGFHLFPEGVTASATPTLGKFDFSTNRNSGLWVFF